MTYAPAAARDERSRVATFPPIVPRQALAVYAEYVSRQCRDEQGGCLATPWRPDFLISSCPRHL